MSRLRSFFSLTVKSPLFASVTATSPSCRPVRREVFSTSEWTSEFPQCAGGCGWIPTSELPGGVK